MTDTIIHCPRCEVRCRVSQPGNPKAKLLRRSKEPKGLCVNCAVHDWLRNTYPCNILLAQSGPKALVLPHIQEQFAGIMRVGLADAMPDEIKWDLIIENWDLPFPSKIKPSCTNPCSQLELDKITSGERSAFGEPRSFESPNEQIPARLEDMDITSFEQLNKLEPGLGDDLKKCLGPEEKGSQLGLWE